VATFHGGDVEASLCGGSNGAGCADSSLEPAAPYRATRSTAAAWRLAVESEDPSGSSHLLLIAGKEAGGRQMTADRFSMTRGNPHQQLWSGRVRSVPVEIPQVFRIATSHQLPQRPLFPIFPRPQFAWLLSIRSPIFPLFFLPGVLSLCGPQHVPQESVRRGSDWHPTSLHHAGV